VPEAGLPAGCGRAGACALAAEPSFAEATQQHCRRPVRVRGGGRP
jgi:hypothetical protein